MWLLLYIVREVITHCMCRQQKNLGRNFITGSVTIPFAFEGWWYISSTCDRYGLTIHGLFIIKCKHLQIINNLDCNVVRVISNTEVIEFVAKTHFDMCSLLSGHFSQYGISEDKPKAGYTVKVLPHHHMFHMGRGLESSSYSFKKRNNADFGINLRYGLESSTLGISV